MLWYHSHTIRDGTEHKSFAVLCRIEFQNGSNVATAIAIVGRRPNGDEFFVEHVLDALLHQLVCTADQLEIVQMHELYKRE